MTVTEEFYRMWHWVGSGATDNTLHVQSVVWRCPTTTLYSSDCEKIALTHHLNPLLIKFLIFINSLIIRSKINGNIVKLV